MKTRNTRKNVLFIAVDDLNCRLGCYGDAVVKSPNLDRLAARGRLFERNYCQYPLCNPSRASFMTGLYPDQINVHNLHTHFREAVPDVVSLPQLFRQNGWFTARSGKVYHKGIKHIGENGLDDAPSWDRVENPKGRDKTEEDQIFSFEPGQFGATLSWRNIDAQDEELTDGMVANDVIGMLKEKRDEPFFIAAGFWRPHTPNVAPAKYFDLYPLEDIPLPAKPPEGATGTPGHDRFALKKYPYMSDGVDEELKARQYIRAYFASVSYLDAQVGRILDALDELRLAEKTVVVFTADHGFHLGEQNLWLKNHLYEPSVHVPLIIADPDAPAPGSRCAGFTESLDLYSTLPALCGLAVPDWSQGRSLTPQLADPDAPARMETFTQCTRKEPKHDGGSAFNGYSIRTGQFRYSEYFPFGEPVTADSQPIGVELFDYSNDPHEWWNQAENHDYQETAKQLSRRLHEKIAQAHSQVSVLSIKS